MHIWRRAAVVASLSLGLAACGGDEVTAFSAGIEPLEPVQAPAPAARGDVRYPEAIVTVTGLAQGYEWAHGYAYVQAPLARVYEALRDPEVTTDRRRVTEFTVTLNSEPEYPYSYRVRNVVRDIVTLQFDMDWRLGPYEGTPESPTAVIGVYQKTWGSSFLSLLRGSVVARAVSPEVTSLEMVRHIRAAAAGRNDAEQYLEDCFASIVARVHGRPLPRYN